MSSVDECDLTFGDILRAAEIVPRHFRGTPQVNSWHLSRTTGRNVIAKIETLTSLGSFKGRGVAVLACETPAVGPWVCETAGNFGIALAHYARAHGTTLYACVEPTVPAVKLRALEALGAHVRVGGGAAATQLAEAVAGTLVVDGLSPAMAAGAGTIGLELAADEPIDTVLVQLGDGALGAGVGCAVKHIRPRTRVIGVCAEGSPAMATSFHARQPMAVAGDGTIATSLAIERPLPEAFTRVLSYLDDVVTVSDDNLRDAMSLITDSLGLLVEPAGAAGIAALLRYTDIPGDRVAVILTGSGARCPLSS